MTPDDRLDKVRETLDYVATLQRSHDEQIGHLVEQMAEINAAGRATDQRIDVLTQRMGVLTERTIQAMDAINRLARIADNHENRIEGLEDRPS